MVTAVFLKHVKKHSKEIKIVGTKLAAAALPSVDFWEFVSYTEGTARVRSPIEASIQNLP